METVSLELPDLRTAENVRAVTEALLRVRGVRGAILDLKTRLGVVHYDSSATDVRRLLSVCRQAGFSAVEYQVESRFPKPVKLKGG